MQVWIGIPQDHGSHTPLQDEVNEAYDGSGEGLQTRCEHGAPGRKEHKKNEYRNRELSTLIVNIETDVQAE